jgi:hypothetical protein
MTDSTAVSGLSPGAARGAPVEEATAEGAAPDELTGAALPGAAPPEPWAAVAPSHPAQSPTANVGSMPTISARGRRIEGSYHAVVRPRILGN